MLDMGFIPDVERIVSLLPKTRQTLFFSATMGPEIRRLADAFLRNPKEIAVSRPASVATTITEGLALVAEHDKREALRRLIRTQERAERADLLQSQARRRHPVQIADAGINSVPARCTATWRRPCASRRWRNSRPASCGCWCAATSPRAASTSAACRTCSISTCRIHAEDYVHRIGRTGRAGLEGHAFTIADAGGPARGGGDREADRPSDPASRWSRASIRWTGSEDDGRNVAAAARKKAEPRRSAARQGRTRRRTARRRTRTSAAERASRTSRPSRPVPTRTHQRRPAAPEGRAPGSGRRFKPQRPSPAVSVGRRRHACRPPAMTTPPDGRPRRDDHRREPPTGATTTWVRRWSASATTCRPSCCCAPAPTRTVATSRETEA